MGFDLWSTTPSNNDMANYFQTGMRPSAVKTAGWDIQADLASMAGLKGVPAATGTANAIAVANARPFTALHVGCECWFFATATNTGSATFSPDGLPAKIIIKNGGPLIGGEIANGGLYCVRSVGASGSDTVLQWNIVIANGAAITGQDIMFGTYIYAADTGSVNALAIAPPVGGIIAYANGQSFLVKVANTTTNSTPTIAVSGLAVKNLYYPDGTTQIIAGALILNNIYRMTYDSSLNAAAGGFIVESPSDIAGSFTITFSTSYFTVQQTATINYRIGSDGKSVWIILPNISGTSNATGLTGTGVPAILSSSFSSAISVVVVNSGAPVMGIMTGINSTSWSFAQGINNAFANTGTKGINGAQTYSYNL